jgi:hypothetical protein
MKKMIWIKWLLLFSITLPALGYRLTQDFINGFYWATLPVKFTIAESNPQRKNLLTELASSAIREWEIKSGLALWDLTDSGATNIIRWSTNFAAETRMDPNTVLAVAIRYTEGPYFAKSEIVINGNHKDFNSGMAWLDKMNLGTTLVHELGHTMGLDHSEVLEAVMAPMLQIPYPGLHDDDINGLVDSHQQTEQRQITKYISPLAYREQVETSQPLSCGTTAPVAPVTAQSGLYSLGIGLLISFVRKITEWFKSLF